MNDKEKELEGVVETQSVDFDVEEIKKNAEEIKDGIESNVDELVEELEGRLEELDRELTEEEKKEIYIEQLKASIMHHKPIKHRGNITVNRFGKADKKHRQKRNKMRKAANKCNRK